MPSDAPRSAGSETPSALSGRGRRTVLVVEDEALIRMGVAEALRKAGYAVIEACSAAEAMDVVLSGMAPDVLFTDVMLSGHVDGLQLAALLERIVPGLIVVIASGRFMPDDLRLKVNFLRKPFEPETAAAHVLQVAPLAGA